MTKEKHPRPKTRMLRCPSATDEIHHTSNRLTREYQPRADDLNPGSHLEVGELAKRRIYPFIGIGSGGATNGYALTLLMKTRKRRASVDHDTVGVLSD